jgi:hypothetical protein
MKHARLHTKHWTKTEDERLRSLPILGMTALSTAAELEGNVFSVRAWPDALEFR